MPGLPGGLDGAQDAGNRALFGERRKRKLNVSNLLGGDMLDCREVGALLNRFERLPNRQEHEERVYIIGEMLKPTYSLIQ